MKRFTQHHFVTAGLGALSIAALLFVQACTDGKGESIPIPKSSDPIPVRVITLTKSSASSEIRASGQLTTNSETILGFKFGGVIQKVYVDEGDAVRKGQLLASLDLTEINTAVTQAQLGVEKAQRDYNRAQNLYRDSVATLEQLQNAETALRLAKEQLQAVNFNKSHASIHASENGFVLRKFANDGQVVGIGDPVLMVNGASKGDWILEVGVSDRQWATIRNGDHAKVSIDAFPSRSFPAVVIRKSGTSDPRTGAFTIELKLSPTDVKLASGMFGSASIQSAQTVSGWAVPYDAVLDANDNEGFVFVTTDNKSALKRAVVIESFDEKEIRIAKGLEDADALIVSGSAYLTDKSPIKIIE